MSTSDAPADLKIEATPGQRGSTTLTARLGEVVLHHANIDLGKPKQRAEFADSVIGKSPGLNRDEIERELLRIATSATTQYEEAVATDSVALLAKMPAAIREQAQAMLDSPSLMEQIVDDVQACGVAGERDLASTIYLVGVSRLLPRPLAAIVSAPTASGKTYTVETVAKLFPAESVLHATAISPKALVYMRNGELRNKFVISGERRRHQDDQSADATKMLREMISSGKISQLVAMVENGRPCSLRVEQEGPIAFIETTTATTAEIFDEDMNRCLILATDEQPEQTERVIKSMASRYAGKGTNNTDHIIQKHHAMQRILRHREVVTPFAEDLVVTFEMRRTEARRAFSHYMAVIEASAVLHQFQRDTDSSGRIVATAQDREWAERLCRKALARLLEGTVSDAAKRFGERLATWFDTYPFTVLDAANKDRKSKTTVQGWLHELEDVGEVQMVGSQRGPHGAAWMRIGTCAPSGCTAIPVHGPSSLAHPCLNQGTNKAAGSDNHGAAGVSGITTPPQEAGDNPVANQSRTDDGIPTF